MIANLTFHIGPPKTGSTSIQQALFDNLCFPKSVKLAYTAEFNARKMAQSLIIGHNEVRNYADLFSRKADWLRNTNADIGVISSEAFGKVDPARLRDAIAEYFPEYANTVKIIAYARPQPTLLLSLYGQRVRSKQFDGTLEQFTIAMRETRELDLFALFKPWRDVFHDQFVLRPFAKHMFESGNLVNDFFHTVLDGKEFKLCSFPHINPALYVDELASVIHINRALVKHKITPMLVTKFAQIYREALQATPDKRSGVELTLHTQLATNLHGSYIESTRELDRMFFGSNVISGEFDKALATAAEHQHSLDPRSYWDSATLLRVSEHLGALYQPALQIHQKANIIRKNKVGERMNTSLQKDDIKESIAQSPAQIAEIRNVLNIVAKIFLEFKRQGPPPFPT